MKNLTKTFVFLITFSLPLSSLAFSTFEDIPFIGGSITSTEIYVNAVYRLLIGAAALLAVIKLMMAGFKYMLTDVVTSKADAKKDIKASLIGLLIILSATTLLGTINPEITKLDILRNASKVTVQNTATQNTQAEKTGDKIPCTKLTPTYYSCKEAINECTAAGGTYSEKPNLIYCAK